MQAVGIYLVSVTAAAVGLTVMPTYYPGYDHEFIITYFGQGKEREQGGFKILLPDKPGYLGIDFYGKVNGRLMKYNYTKGDIRRSFFRLNETHWEANVWPCAVYKGDIVYYWFVFTVNDAYRNVTTLRSHYIHVRTTI